MKNPLKIVALVTVCHCLSILFCQAQNKPVAESAADMVDLFTGDFTYSVPLLTVTGPNGENFPVIANYRSGIRTNQDASWIGLGWELETGEIVRQVNGVPDDWKGKTVSTTGASSVTYTYFGPLYFKDFTAGEMDIYQSDRNLKSGNTAFEFPDYDGYYMSGPGIGGELSPHLFDYASFRHTDNSDFNFDDTEKSFAYSSKRMQFKFRNEPVTKVFAPVNANGEFLAMDENNADGIMVTPNEATTGFTGDYNAATNRMIGGNYIEYFTNTEINTFDPSQSGNSIKQKGFLDFRVPGTGARRPSTGFDPDGIGAFKVTTPSGLTYHYSLPVYNLSERVLTVDIQRIGSNFPDFLNLAVNEKNAKYAISWKLTAITGLDYEDANNNGIADIGDKGYWIALEYGLWTNGFDSRSPYFGYDADLRTRKKVVIHNQPFLDYNEYQEEGSIIYNTSQVYYLNKIKTATQTAFFVKEIRLDAHSGGNAIVPKLKLSKIILLNNADAGLFSSTQDISDPSGNFSLTSSVEKTILNNNQYTANKTSIDNASLKTIEFSHDYSLSKNLYNNILSLGTISGNTTLTIPNADFPDFTIFALEDPSFINIVANSGKLTLNEINIYEFGHKKISPSYIFDYNVTNADDNPQYDHRKTDFFGFYKSDATKNGGYITGITKDATDVWSLRKITTPIGAEIEIEYESDSYSKIGYDSPNGNPVAPGRTFRITAITTPATVQPTITVEPEAVDMISDNIKQIGIFYKFYCPNNDDCTGAGRVSNNITVSGAGNNQITVTGGITSTGSLCFNCNGGTASYQPQNHGYGFLKYTMNEAYGGGIRVKAVRVKDTETNNVYQSEFSYLNSGIATTEPDRFAPANPSQDFTVVLQESKHGSDRHALPPMVGYTNVEVKNIGQTGALTGKTKYTFVNYNEPFSVSTEVAFPRTDAGLTSYYSLYEVINITNGNSNYGQLREITSFDNFNNVISHTKNEYEMIGRTDEIFYRGLTINDPYSYGLIPNGQTLITLNGVTFIKSVFKKSLYSGVLKSTTTTTDGTQTKTEIIQRDPIAGFPTKILITDQTNGITETELIPAYTISGNTIMGSKGNSDANKNMLTQIATETTKRNNKVVSGTHTLWTNQIPFRKYSGGLYGTVTSTSVFSVSKNFVFDGHPLISDWKETGAPTLYTPTHKLIEQKGIGNQFNAVKFGYDDQYKIAEVSNANYSSFTYSGFEDIVNIGTSMSPVYHFDGEVTGVNYRFASTSTIKAHTGNYMAALPASTIGPAFVAKENNVISGLITNEKGLQTGRTYRAAVWIHKDSPANAQLVAHLTGTLSDGSIVNNYLNIAKSASTVQSGDWFLLALNIEVPKEYKSTGGQFNDLRVYLNNPGTTNAYFDDFRVHPVDAQMSAYVYDKKRGLVTHVLDNENFYTRYLYDEAGRIIESYLETIEGEKIVSKTVYKFARD